MNFIEHLTFTGAIDRAAIIGGGVGVRRDKLRRIRTAGTSVVTPINLNKIFLPEALHDEER